MTVGGRPGLVVIGASLGGLAALPVLLRALPADYGAPLVIVQHRGQGSDDLAAALQRGCLLPVREVEDKDPLRPGVVFLAPTDYHVLVDEGRLCLSTEPRVHHARPSIDVLFESAAAVYGVGVLAVVLTGTSRDGAFGALQVKRRGGVVLVQDPRTAEGRLMPEAAIAATHVDRVLTLDQLAEALRTA